METETQIVGQSLPRLDALDKVQGKAEYTVDLALPRMLYGSFLCSPLARAKILNIDASKARRVPGVRVVVTGKDFPYTYGSTIKDRPFLAQGEVRYVGEPVAAAAATSQEAAEEALELIRVEYEEMEPILDPEAALLPGASLVHENLRLYKHSEAATPVPDTNICSHYKLRKGDVEEGFGIADFIYENSYRSQMVQHVCLEPHAAVAQWVPGSRRLTVWVGTVSPFMSRKELADGLAIPMNHIRIVVPQVGGSFGSKMYLKAETLAVALAWFADGRPVKVVFERADEFPVAVKGPTLTKIKTGVKKDGAIEARQELAEGVIRVKDQPEKLIALKDVVPKYFGYRGGTIVGRGIYRPTAISPDKETGQTAKITPFWMYGTQAAEVEVDPQTGKVEVLRLVAYHDVGHAINPTNCMQQIEGAVLMGLGGALLEEVVLNERGATVNPNLHDYKVYTAVDVPGLEVGLIETEQSEGPFGAKGVGEPALAATAPAIGNAIFAACGVRIRELPITPEKMLFALKAAQVLQPDERGVKYA